MTDLIVNRKCVKDGCDTAIQASSAFFARTVSDNDYVSCPNGHYQPLFAFGSPEAQIAWLERSLLTLQDHLTTASLSRESALRCPFHQRGIVLRDANHLVTHIIRKHRERLDSMLYAAEIVEKLGT